MAKPRACDVCSLRKIKCNGSNPCLPCLKAGFDCSFAKKPLKPGPKGPRLATSNRIRKQLDDIRAHGGSTSSRNASSSPSRLPRSVPDQSSPDEFLDNGSTSNGMHKPSDSQQITFRDVCAYLEMYHHKMYPVWPVIDRKNLINRVGEDMEDPEYVALAFAVCAATGAQLRLDTEPNQSIEQEQISLCDQFAIEAERLRTTYDHREGATIAGVLIPFFLHAYYTKKNKRFSSTIYIREAVTLAQLLGLDHEASYEGLPAQEVHYRRKVFWLLFVTERGHVMQYDINAILRPSISMPSAEDDKDPNLIRAFMTLVSLFVKVDGMLAGTGVDDPGRVFSPESLEALQTQLRQAPDFTPFSNELQKTDVFVTQQWIRILLWQLSMKKITLNASDSEDPFSLTYPTRIARDSLSFLSKVSLDSLISHGPGMELKIFEVANTLLDVINIVPTLHVQGDLISQQGPRDVFHALSCLLSSIASRKSTSITLLQSKIAESIVPFQPIPRLLELHDNEHSSSPTSSNFPSAGGTNPHSNELGSLGSRIDGWVQGQDEQQPPIQDQALFHIDEQSDLTEAPVHNPTLLFLRRQDTTDSNTLGSWSGSNYSSGAMELVFDEQPPNGSSAPITPHSWNSAMT